MRNPFRALFSVRQDAIGSAYDLAQYLLGRQTVAGQAVTASTALNVAAVWTGIHIRSRLLAALPIGVVQKVGRQSIPRPEHPTDRLLQAPNRFSLRQTKSELFGMLESHRLLRGSAFLWMNLVMRPSGDGVRRLDAEELLPMPPDQVEVIEAPDEWGPSTYRLHQRSGKVLDLPSNEVIHLKTVEPLDHGNS